MIMVMSRTEDHGALPFGEPEYRSRIACRTPDLALRAAVESESIAVKVSPRTRRFGILGICFPRCAVVVLISGYTPKNDLLIITVINYRSYLAGRPLSDWSRLPPLIQVHDSQSFNQIYRWRVWVALRSWRCGLQRVGPWADYAIFISANNDAKSLTIYC